MLLSEKNKDLRIIHLKLFLFVILEKMFWFLILVLLNDLRNLFLFCINVNIDGMFLLKKK